MPSLSQASSNGTVVMNFSSQIQAVNLTEFKSEFMKIGDGEDKDARRQRRRSLDFEVKLDLDKVA